MIAHGIDKTGRKNRTGGRVYRWNRQNRRQIEKAGHKKTERLQTEHGGKM
jgi:hypothetical protein